MGLLMGKFHQVRQSYLPPHDSDGVLLFHLIIIIIVIIIIIIMLYFYF